MTVIRGGRLVFRDISWTAESGSVLAVHGRNGAGKSTLLRCVAGLLEPASGRVHFGLPRGDEREASALVHYVGHHDAVKAALSVRETLQAWRRVLGGSAQQVDMALAKWQLLPIAELPGQYLSAGQRRRVALARLSVADRPVWLLDEPSAALDQAARAILLDNGEAHLRAGGIILAASHEPLWPQARVLDLSLQAAA
ncbi:MAG TPA: heme ABC exporter ATP-binding protein CcmA [Alphaproteobacteria bacterium]|nr:heme ABC exporter ATP-binding protein CcmA [Alphaproteobacteria bacterium]